MQDPDDYGINSSTSLLYVAVLVSSFTTAVGVAFPISNDSPKDKSDRTQLHSAEHTFQTQLVYFKQTAAHCMRRVPKLQKKRRNTLNDESLSQAPVALTIKIKVICSATTAPQKRRNIECEVKARKYHGSSMFESTLTKDTGSTFNTALDPTAFVRI